MRKRQNIPVQRKKKPIIFMVPRKREGQKQERKFDIDDCIRALQVKTVSDRTEHDVDAIMAIVGKWPDFQQFIKTEQARREVCRSMSLTFIDENKIFFKEGDPADGWCLILFGAVTIYGQCPTNQYHDSIRISHLELLQSTFGSDRMFIPFCVKKETEQFGNTALIKNAPRNATIITNERCGILIVDPQIYKDTAAWFDRILLDKKSSLLGQVKELASIKGLKDVLSRLAENMIEHKLENPGEVFDHHSKIGDGYILVAEGLLAKHRVVDFSTYVEPDPDPEDNTPQIPLRIPHSKKSVRTLTYGPKMMFPDPSLDDLIGVDFMIIVVEPAVVYELKPKDLESALPSFRVEAVKELFRTEPSDQEIMEKWVETQRALAWRNFKKRCVTDARDVINTEKEILRGQFGLRKAGIPISIREHKAFPILPGSRMTSSCPSRMPSTHPTRPLSPEK